MTPAQTQLREDRSALEAEIKGGGGEIRGNAVRCPFHEDKHASGSIYQGSDGAWRFKCQVPTCGVSGDIFDIRAKVSGRPLADVLREADPGAAVQRGLKQSVNSPKIHKTLADLRQAVAWVVAQSEREIEAEYSYANPDTGSIDLLIFRAWKPGVLHNKEFKQAHPVPGGWIMNAGEKPWPLYRRAEIREARDIVVVEGEKKADALNAIGIVATTSPCGAGKAEHADWRPLAGKRVWLWPDNDPDGTGRLHVKQVQVILGRLDPVPAIRLIEPNDLDLGPKEDAADFIAQCRVAGLDPKRAVLDVLAQAKQIDALTDYRARQVQIARGELRAVPLPWPELTRLTRAFQPGRVTILAGSKGAAKSFFRLACQRYWLQLGERVALYLMEGSVAEELDRALAQWTENPDFTDPEWQRANPDEVRAATDRHAEELARLSSTVTRSSLGATVSDVAAWLEAEAPRQRILCVDPVTMAATVRSPWDDAKMLMDRAKRATETHGCSILLVSHLQKGAEPGDSDRLAGGASFERFSDTIIQLHRHDARASLVKTALGRVEMPHNQTVFIEKARAPGTGYRLAYTFAMAHEQEDGGPLTFNELGIIVKAKKG